MSELRELYQEFILDHGRNPRNRGTLETALRADGHNPLCGDRVTIYVEADGDRIERVVFEGSGCAICLASASVMTEELTGRTRQEADRLFKRFHEMVTEGRSAEGLGHLAAFEGVGRFPMRVKCATLPWHTFRAAVQGEHAAVSTE